MGAVAYITPAMPGRAAVRLRLVECRAILGGERDRLRDVWDHAATAKDRRLLLAMAGRSGAECGRLASRAWVDLSPEMRVSIAGGLRRWSDWAARLGGAP